jgi:hypothetical protein
MILGPDHAQKAVICLSDLELFEIADAGENPLAEKKDLSAV